jgi:hypothetical protein
MKHLELKSHVFNSGNSGLSKYCQKNEMRISHLTDDHIQFSYYVLICNPGNSRCAFPLHL